MSVLQVCSLSVCSTLLAEQQKLARFEIDAAAASSAYEPHDPNTPTTTRTPPPGYRNATDDDLATMNLTRDFIENPTMPHTDNPSDFRAAVFVNETTREKLVAFKGTSSLEDWKNNLQQGSGMDSAYYTRAQAIADKIQNSSSAASVRYTGHSLGGGMASAAATRHGLPATTFNAAGLNAKNAEGYNADIMCVKPPDIDAVNVRGEILTGVQSLGLPKAASSTSWPLDPPAGFGKWLLAGGALLGAKGLAAATLVRSGLLHLMDSVDKSLAQRNQQLADLIKKNGC